ncbi:MAG: DUF1844 domain-containing protein [Phycisphaerales bacterium]|nr:DUF1844 domain-containing protein [Phycisphaerales bacterium]
MNQTPNESNIHVDSDWKAQAEAEREKLRKIDADRASATPENSHEKLPPADFRSIVGLLATQALSGLGAYGDPATGRVVVDLPGAQFAIDLLGVLVEKTKGNLSDEENKELTAILAELRSRFVQLTQMVAAQTARGGPASIAAPTATNTAGKDAPQKSKIIFPG